MLTGWDDGRFDVSWSGAAGENPVDLAIVDLDEDADSRTSRSHTRPDRPSHSHGVS